MVDVRDPGYRGVADMNRAREKERMRVGVWKIIWFQFCGCLIGVST